MPPEWLSNFPGPDVHHTTLFNPVVAAHSWEPERKAVTVERIKTSYLLENFQRKLLADGVCCFQLRAEVLQGGEGHFGSLNLRTFLIVTTG